MESCGIELPVKVASSLVLICDDIQQVQPDLRDLMDTMNSMSSLPDDFEGKDKVNTW